MDGSSPMYAPPTSAMLAEETFILRKLQKEGIVKGDNDDD
jgi:hypothetical protein